jgi:DNA-binding response OmpR family regulator
MKNRPAHILVVGSAPCTLALLLTDSGMFHVTATKGTFEEMALIIGGTNRFDAVVLDLPLTDTDAPSFCAFLRHRGFSIPIVAVGEKADEEEVIRTLDSGAIDYIARPVRTEELSARLRTHIRTHERSETAVLSIGPYHFRPAARSLLEPSTRQTVRLTRKEVGILTLLYHAAGGPVSREELLREVWGYHRQAQTHTVETHIYRLRHKIERNPSAPSLILNNTERGYSLSQH